MKKRLRKKLHKGEFKEFGCTVDVTIKEQLTHDEIDQWLSELIDLAEKNEIVVEGGGDHHLEFFAIHAFDSTVTPQQLDALKKWLEASPAVEKFEFGQLVDAWHPGF